MCSLKLTQSQYAHQVVVETVGEQIAYFNEQRLIHICRVLSFYVNILSIEYDVHSYITTGLLPFEEFSEERLWTDEEEW